MALRTYVCPHCNLTLQSVGSKVVCKCGKTMKVVAEEEKAPAEKPVQGVLIQ